jgi:phospho-N-acetylmuramoyl-pentapeptide-transferase
MTQALLTGAIAAMLSALLGGPLISWLRARGLGKAISSEGPESHLSKAGTPTMGGLLFVGVALAMALVVAVPDDSDVLLPVMVMGVVCAIGVYDDLGTLVGKESRDAHDRTGMILKLIGFAGVGVVAGWILYDSFDAPRLLVPNRGHYDVGAIYIAIALAVIVATTSSVGVTDGLDTLAGGTSAVAYAAYGTIALTQDQTAVATFAFAVTGSLVGFLYWNAYPARLFMGEAGALPLGAGLAVLALMTGWWLLLPLIGVVFVVEILSDAIQIGVYRTRGWRVFRMAPIHHHFEELGWHEVTISAGFIALGVLGALVGVALAAWGT